MTGAEIVAGAAAVKRAFSDDESQKEQLRRLAEDTPEMREAARQLARRVQIRQGLITKLYGPLARFVDRRGEYFENEFQEDLANKVKNIPEENLSTPPPSVAIPAMEGLSYSIDDPDLKEMYLSLLATATDGRSAHGAHPSFAEIIKQLSPNEAKVLLDVLRLGSVPMVRLRRLAASGPGAVDLFNNVVDWQRAGVRVQEPMVPAWIDNWARLGLVDLDYGRALVREGAYDWVRQRPEFLAAVSADERGEDGVEIVKGILRCRDFGARFLQAVSYDGVPVNGAPGVVTPGASSD